MPNVKPARKGVFISYARTDGEEFATLLRQRLETEEISLWQDRVGMEGGRDWWLQITEALDQVEFMALVITPNALKSDTVRKEWRYARQQGVCVYPIKGSPDLDFNSLPRWMRDAHFYDLEREWPKFVNDLNMRCQQKRVPFMVDDLPEGFVERPGEFDRLLKLLSRRTDSDHSGASRRRRLRQDNTGESVMSRRTCSGCIRRRHSLGHPR